VPGATVQVIGQSLTGTTSSTGEYVLKTVSRGNRSIKVTHTGYADKQVDNLTVKLGKSIKADVTLLAAISV
jgi:hypothetical protein